MIKTYMEFLNEADLPPVQPAPAQPPTTQPPVQSSGTTQAQPVQTEAQQPAQPDQSAQTEQKQGDLSNYNNDGVTKFPETVKKMVDLIKDMDKTQLIKLRNLIAELKNIEDDKSEIGKL